MSASSPRSVFPIIVGSEITRAEELCIESVHDLKDKTNRVFRSLSEMGWLVPSQKTIREISKRVQADKQASAVFQDCLNGWAVEQIKDGRMISVLDVFSHIKSVSCAAAISAIVSTGGHVGSTMKSEIAAALRSGGKNALRWGGKKGYESSTLRHATEEIKLASIEENLDDFNSVALLRAEGRIPDSHPAIVQMLKQSLATCCIYEGPVRQRADEDRRFVEYMKESTGAVPVGYHDEITQLVFATLIKYSEEGARDCSNAFVRGLYFRDENETPVHDLGATDVQRAIEIMIQEREPKAVGRFLEHLRPSERDAVTPELLGKAADCALTCGSNDEDTGFLKILEFDASEGKGGIASEQAAKGLKTAKTDAERCNVVMVSVRAGIASSELVRGFAAVVGNGENAENLGPVLKVIKKDPTLCDAFVEGVAGRIQRQFGSEVAGRVAAELQKPFPRA